MTRWRLTALAAGLSVALAACGGGAGSGGGDTAAGKGGDGAQAGAKLDCDRIEFIVPFSPGGGSDRQVRRLQPYLEDALGASINVTYQTGGDGAVGWLALSNSQPDGCTAGNVVSPDVILLSKTKNVGFSYKDFEYVAWTETGPIILTVAAKGDIDTVDEFVSAAKANPGGLTVAATGETGRLITAAMADATGIEVSYVPVSGGVGDIVPQLLGGQVDAGMLSAAAVADRPDTLQPLALTGTKKLPSFPDTPTFGEAGYETVALTYTWALALPPGTPDNIVKIWNDAVQTALSEKKLQQKITQAGLVPLSQTPKEADAFVKEQAKSVDKARAALKGQN